MSKPSSYAPGAGGFGLVTIGTGASASEHCGGCRRTPPDGCSACGSAAIARVLSAGAHALPLCMGCWRVVREWKQESRAAKKAQTA